MEDNGELSWDSKSFVIHSSDDGEEVSGDAGAVAAASSSDVS